MIRRLTAVAVTLFCCLSAVTGYSQSPASKTDLLRVSAIPDEAPTELQRKFEPLGAYLEEQLGVPVEFIPVTDYAAVVEALAAGRIDLAWLGGFTFVQARLKTGDAVPLVQRDRDREFTSKFISGDPSVTTVEDLQGRSFAFGSVSSTSGHLMPRYFMAQKGIEPESFFSRIGYSGAHDATAAWVEAGKVDGGVVNAAVWEKLVASGKVDTAKVHVFATTAPYYDYNWTVRGGLEPALQAKIKQAFLSLDGNIPAHKVILDLQSAERFIETSADNYRGIEQAARKAGLLED